MAISKMQDLLARAKQSLRDSGELLPVLLVEGAEESALVGFAELGGTAKERQRLMIEVGIKLAHLRPRRVTAVMDAYCRVDLDGRMPTGSLADDPAAQDCIMVVSLDRKGRSRMLLCPYERHPTLEGLKVRFFKTKRLADEGGRPFLLEAFFAGVQAAGKEQPLD